RWQPPRPQPPVPPAQAVGPAATVAAPAAEPEAKAKAPDLTINKLVAGAGAAATSAVFGSYFGAAGTVTGAAVGSVITTLGSTIYQRSLDRTRDKVKAKIKLPSGRTVEVTRDAAAGPGGADPATVRMPAPRISPEGRPTGVPPRPGVGVPARQVSPALDSGRKLRPRQIAVMSGVTVLIFALGLLVVTGVEWAKGSPLSGGDSGTSVSRVFSGSTATDQHTGTTGKKGTDSTGSTGSTGTTQAPSSVDPSATDTPTPTATPTPETSSPEGTGNLPAPQTAAPTQDNGSSGGRRNATPAPTSGALLPGIGG
ncbi:hypothetical protein, partial [Pseudonocardia acidicola]